MRPEPYGDWISIYNDDIKVIWEEERVELRKLSMIYCAFQKELNRLKNDLSNEISGIKSELKMKDRLQKCKNFAGLAQSEYFGDVLVTNDKENETPDIVPLRQLDFNETKQDDFFIESPNTSTIFEVRSPSPKPTQNNTATSPIINKSPFLRFKRKSSNSPPNRTPVTKPKLEETSKANLKTEFKTPKNCDDSNIMECSIIEDTPDLKVTRRTRPRLTLKKPNKKLNRSGQTTTLTQMFLEPKKTRVIDSNLPSMTITEMINLINDSSDSDTDADLDNSDSTVDDLEAPKPSQKNPADLSSFVKNFDKIPEKKPDNPKFVYNEVVRGKERKKLKGWSCNQCKDYYENLNLPPDELEKKKDECSRHRHKFQPREETYKGFWDLTFGPTPKTQDSEKSLEFNFKKS